MNPGPSPQVLISPAGPAHGPHAAALALGAPEAIRQGLYWNWPERPGTAPGTLDATTEERLAMARRWKINSSRSWLQVTEAMIRGLRINDEPAEIALDVRDEELERSGAAELGLEDWLPAISAHAVRQQWSAEYTDLVLRSAVKTFHAEQQLVRDGLLPAGRRVVTVFAHDLVHATYLTQAGMRTGYADPGTAAQLLAALAPAAGTVYASWADFGAAHVLGCSVIDGGYPGDDVYRAAADTVALLLTSPVSPWTNIPLPGTA